MLSALWWCQYRTNSSSGYDSNSSLYSAITLMCTGCDIFLVKLEMNVDIKFTVPVHCCSRLHDALDLLLDMVMIRPIWRFLIKHLFALNLSPVVWPGSRHHL